MTEKKRTFKTEFINKRLEESAQIMFADKPSGLFVPANSTFEIETENPLDLYARFSKVQFMRNLDIKLTERSGWKDTEKTLDYGTPYVVKFFNRDGANWVGVYLDNLGNRPTLIPKGIPRYLGVSLDSQYVRYTEYRWEFQLHKEPIEGTGYFTETWGLRQYGIEREKSELKKIGELIKERDMESAKETAERNVDNYLKQKGLS